MKRHLLGVCCIAALFGTAAPAVAYDDEVHYALTYYVARCAGYTSEQASRISNACVGVDYAFDTEPVQMHGGRFGAELLLIRGVGDLLPEVGDVLDENFNPQGAVDFLDPEKTSEYLESPGSLYNQGPRLKFHAFIREPGGESGKPWDEMSAAERDAYLADENKNLLGQAVLLWNDAVRHRNPGVFLHFFQDRVPHAGYGAKYGHYDVFINKHRRMAYELPNGPITDWMSFRSQPGEPNRCLRDDEHDRLAANIALFEATAKRLTSFMKQASERQIPLPVAADPKLIMKLVQANCPPNGNLKSVGDLITYKKDDTPFRPNLDRTRLVFAQQMRTVDKMKEGQIPPPRLPLPYTIRADRKYYFASLRDQDADYYEELGGEGEDARAESDRWVLWGDLTVKLAFPAGYVPTETFEVVALLPRTHDRETEYELKSLNAPWPIRYLADDAPAVLTDLPVGEVVIELRRNGKPFHRHPQLVPITKRKKNTVEVRVGEDLQPGGDGARRIAPIE